MTVFKPFERCSLIQGQPPLATSRLAQQWLGNNGGLYAIA